MSDEKLEKRIQKRCLALAKDLLKTGDKHKDEELMLALLDRVFRCASKIKTARQVYDWLVKNKYDPDVAWGLSGLVQVMKDSG